MSGRYVRRIRAPRSGVLHVETALGIVNIYLGLHDATGRAVERIEITPDADVMRRGPRLIRRARRDGVA